MRVAMAIVLTTVLLQGASVRAGTTITRVPPYDFGCFGEDIWIPCNGSEEARHGELRINPTVGIRGYYWIPFVAVYPTHEAGVTGVFIDITSTAATVSATFRGAAALIDPGRPPDARGFPPARICLGLSRANGFPDPLTCEPTSFDDPVTISLTATGLVPGPHWVWVFHDICGYTMSCPLASPQFRVGSVNVETISVVS